MAILKIRDAAGNVQEILAIKGKKGDPGEFTGGELLNSHINNKENPHEVAAADVGAAPTGYGLGEAAPNVSTFNFDGGNGFFEGGGQTDNSSPYVTSWAGQNTTFGDNFEHGYQEVVDVFQNPNVKARRHKLNGVFGDWEYENPPMLLGVEYRTTERWNGKVVWTALINCGYIVNGSTKTTYHGINMTQCLNCVASGDNGDAFPVRFTNNENSYGNVYATPTAVHVYAEGFITTPTIYAKLLYTKD